MDGSSSVIALILRERQTHRADGLHEGPKWSETRQHFLAYEFGTARQTKSVGLSPGLTSRRLTPSRSTRSQQRSSKAATSTSRSRLVVAVCHSCHVRSLPPDRSRTPEPRPVQRTIGSANGLFLSRCIRRRTLTGRLREVAWYGVYAEPVRLAVRGPAPSIHVPYSPVSAALHGARHSSGLTDHPDTTGTGLAPQGAG